jgi:rsbT antagonist protein RsbS
MRIPILKLGNILLTSIQSDMTDEHATVLQADIVGRMQQSRSRGVILDITSLDIVDSYMARILNETARMAQIMGGEVVITSMNPMVALTLVEMGRELVSVMTALTLQQGVEMLQTKLQQSDGILGEAALHVAG